ncbi:MAG: hypothetical protein NBV68_01465 [Erythrobacter sp.]|uniref:hypothetical protein n=1 Tax=Erythrobacter sp. TaxID=1042 RepID=UPI0025E332F9|nr:hypothetical protein [Erythrobacter sp.]MCL9998027.1 hypothetical protein [Erythrobacter sp.]
MIDEPPAPSSPPLAAEAQGEAPAAPAFPVGDNGRVVIDLTQFLPPPPAPDCPDEPPDPFNPEIVVCAASTPAPRLGPVVGPVDEGFGSAIPRARIKLSDTASAEANLLKQGVGGFDADGAEVRLKIGF